MSDRLAETLWRARLEDAAASVAEEDRPPSAAAAYAVQRALTALGGETPIGWKIGATNEPVQALLGVEEPFFAPLLPRFCHASGDEVALPAAHGPGLETEVMVCLGADLAPRAQAWTPEEVEGAVAAVAPSFEIVGSRAAGGMAGAGPMLIADAGANIAAVHGDRLEQWRGIDLRDLALRLRINGESAATGSTSALLWGHPFGAVAWLASHPEIGRRGLRAGDVVMTGTCTGVVPLSPGDEAVADCGALGEVRARFR